MKRIIFLVSVVTVLVLSIIPVSASIKSDMDSGLPLGQVLGNALAGGDSKEEVAAAVEAMVKNGADLTALLNIAFGSNFNNEGIIVGAVKGGGDLTLIIGSALSHGVDPSLIANYCASAGADPDLVATTLANFASGVFAYSSDGTFRTIGSMPSGGLGGGGSNVSPNN